MKVEEANLYYEDSDLLEEVVKWYNHSHRNSTRSCELTIGHQSQHRLKVIDKVELMPYGLHDIGTQIGHMEMKAKFRIKLTGWFESHNKTIYKSDNHPTNETFSIITQNDTQQNIPVRSATGINSNFATVKQYLFEEDIEQIEDKSNLHKLTPSTFQTSSHKRLNFFIQENNLILFGTDLRYGKNHYEIDLDSIYGIEIPKDDF